MPFLDQPLPSKVPATPCVSAPRTKTTITVDSGGGEMRNQEWEHPLMRFVLPEGLIYLDGNSLARDWSVVQALMSHWRVMRGPWRSWPWRDPLDCASCDLTRPNLSTAELLALIGAGDQLVGTGDGFTDAFPLTKTYALGGETYVRTIHLPVLDSVVVAIDGVTVDPADYSVSRPGGVVTFNVPPAAPFSGHPQIITAGYLFDVEVRFESDDALEAILRAHRAAGFADLTLIEVRPC